MKIINKTKNTVLAEEAIVADRCCSRVIGLLGKASLPKGQALVLKPCNSVHTFFMRFAIDVIFVDRNNRIIETVSSLKPWRLSSVYLLAQSCIELPAGTIASSFSSPGDLLFLEQ